jgi:uncharacterized DUF497 family protein
MDNEWIESCEGFDWDLGNFEKNQNKHLVSRWECEQLFFNEPLVIFDDEKHSKSESRHYALGQTDEHKKLMIVFTVRKNLIRVISARPMSRKERKHYEQAEKNTEI